MSLIISLCQLVSHARKQINIVREGSLQLLGHWLRDDVAMETDVLVVAGLQMGAGAGSDPSPEFWPECA